MASPLGRHCSSYPLIVRDPRAGGHRIGCLAIDPLTLSPSRIDVHPQMTIVTRRQADATRMLLHSCPGTRSNGFIVDPSMLSTPLSKIDAYIRKLSGNIYVPVYRCIYSKFIRTYSKYIRIYSKSYQYAQIDGFDDRLGRKKE